MKRSIAPFIAVGLAAAVACPNVFAGSSPGEVDFGQFAELAGNAKYVDIQVSHTLISLASHFVQKEQPEVASLLRSVELVRLNVIGLNDENRDEMVKRVREIRVRLDQQGWQRVVVVQQKSGEDVGIYVKTGAGDAIQGVVLTVLDGKQEAVLVNIVGDIKPSQISALGEALDIDALKKAGDAVKK